MTAPDLVQVGYKECSCCKRVLPVGDYYRKPTGASGLHASCKRCHRESVRKSRARYAEHYRAYDKGRRRKRPSLSLMAHDKAQKERARKRLQKAVLLGRMSKLPCAVCWDSTAEAHHVDYSRPLDVVWLCDQHHGEVHRIDAALRVEMLEVT